MQWQQALTPGACDLTISPAADGKALVRPNGEASSRPPGRHGRQRRIVDRLHDRAEDPADRKELPRPIMAGR